MARGILNCAGCVRRAVFLPIRPRAAFSIPTAIIPPGRRYATTTSDAPSTADDAPSTEEPRTDAPRTFEARELTPEESEKKRKDRFNTVVKMELKYLSEDPWTVQDWVQKALKRDAFDEAYAVVQKRSDKENQMTVAWNFLLDYLLQQQQMKKALRVFNDMKKRAQLPNVRTYTVLFRGLAISHHPKIAVSECLKHYNYLLNDPRLEPNGIHLNAALTVCAKAGDIDAMFVIADSINEGSRAPTASTYTVILNGLRHKAMEEMRAPVEGDKNAEVAAWTDEQKDEHIAALVSKAKGLWGEALSKWESGKLVIDEHLVCAMGRLLLMSPRREERREIFELVETTMKIPNLVKNPELGLERDESMKGVATRAAATPALVNRTKNSKKKANTHAIPSNNTLSLLLTTLAYNREVTVGIKYWNLLVSHYGIVPDHDIWKRMLKMLRATKASAHSANMVEIMPKELNQIETFRVSMETCVRDNLNANAVKNANKIFDHMLERLQLPDPHTMRLYLRTALVTHAKFRTVAQEQGEGKADEGKRLYGEQILKALGALWEPYKQAYYHFWRPIVIRNPEALAENNNNKAEVIALARAMVSAFDKLTNENMLSDVQMGEIRPVAAKIHREIRAHFANTVVTDPAMKRKIDKTQPMAEEITEKEAAAFEEDDPSDAFALKVGPDWVWDTYKPIPPKKTRREIAQEENLARVQKRKEYHAAEALRIERKHARERKIEEREEKEANLDGEPRYPWEPGFEGNNPQGSREEKIPYNVMEMRKKQPAWSRDSPWEKTGPKDKRYKSRAFNPSKRYDDTYHKRPEALGGDQKPRRRRLDGRNTVRKSEPPRKPEFKDAFSERRKD